MHVGRRHSRSAPAIAMTTALLLLVGACGGKAVQQSVADGANSIEQAAGPADTGTATSQDSSTTAAAPGAAAGTATGTTAGGATTTQQDAGKGTAGAATTQTDGKTGGTGKTNPNAPAAATTLTDLVQRTVETQPIFGGSAACRPASGSEIRIGNVSTLSGVLGELFAPVVPALNAFVASQNACGGLNGHRIKLFIADDQDDPTTAISKIGDMVERNKVLALVGDIQPLTMDGVTATLAKYNLPVIGADLVSQVEMTTPLIFPQGQNVQATSYGFLNATANYFHAKTLGNLYCLEVPRPCEAAARANRELSTQFGVQVVKQLQVSITAPSYVQECLQLKNAGSEVVALNIDAASMVRIARSCTQTSFQPKGVVVYPLGVGNEKQFLQGIKWLGGTYVPLNHFPWMASDTPAEKYFQAMRNKYVPGSDNGGAAALGWAAGALLVAVSAGLSPDNPTTQQLFDGLYTFKGQKFTELGGLAGPRTFVKGSIPRVPYCIYPLIANDTDTGWKSWTSKASCTNVLAPSDPMASSG